jgi:Matrixin
MRDGLGRRCAAALLTVGVVAGVALTGLGTETAAAKGGPKFQDGNWKLILSVTLHCAPQAGQLGLGGTGTLDVLKGEVQGTFDATGPGHCQASAPDLQITYDGSYSWQNGKVSGLAAEPMLEASSHFSGTIVSASPFVGTSTQSESTDNGPVTARLVIDSASPRVVLGTVQANGDSTISSSFFATRNCPKGKAPPLLDKHIRNGTPDNPTRVNVVADPSIANVLQLKSALDSTIANWNNILEAAGKNIVFGTTPGNGPTIYVGIDSDAFRNSVASQTGTPALGALPQSEAGHANPLGNTPGSDYSVGAVRLGSESGKPTTWAQYAQTNEQNVVGILTHEFGHMLGLSHDANDKDSIMYPDNQSKREPSAGCSDLRAVGQL